MEMLVTNKHSSYYGKVFEVVADNRDRVRLMVNGKPLWFSRRELQQFNKDLNHDDFKRDLAKLCADHKVILLGPIHVFGTDLENIISYFKEARPDGVVRYVVQEKKEE